jgi:hypothetical protein
MPEQVPGAPPSINTALNKLKDDLSRAAGKNFVGLILYGGLARGRYRPGKSDVNVVVLLHEITAPALAAIGPALRVARRSAGVAPMILTPGEVALTAVVFPTKFLDIKDHHIVLHGEDPFANLQVPREQVRLRIVQELRNLALRLRLRFLADYDDPASLAATLAGLARPLAVELAALLQLAGKEVPQDDRTATVFAAAATTFSTDADALARLAGFRQDGPLPGDLPSLFTSLMKVLSQLIDRAEHMKEATA